MTNQTVVKKDTQKLQRAIVDGLEDVKAQEIQVFDTEHLSALFERVVIASGTSNRQTKALAASVRDAVREAGFPKPRIEGEDNGEWIIVDCGQAVVHIMQPSFRTYYNLEELWGEKPVRLKFGAAKPEVEVSKSVAKPAAKEALKPEGSLRRSNAAKKGVADAFPSKAQMKKTAATKTPAKKVSIQAAPDAPEASRKPVARKAAPAKTAATKSAAVKAAPAKKAATKPVTKQVVKVATKVLVVNAPAKTTAKVAAKKAAIKKSVARKA
jgi:ribosome-associated protein